MIELEINRAYLSGKEDGKNVWNLIRNEIDWCTQNTIVLPDGLSYMTDSFFLGFTEEVRNRTNKLDEVIKFKCANEYIRSLVRIYSECYKK
jgi:hypothetical protein